ncbi:MAG: hypothetical protein OH319_02720 [Candidatus Parvarchaeota archaeon]|nr:hypothetical protein [Candidatus Jingweiarchaeum tengchongense]MCW1298282.1 hypothetical protein [Candidatus Jingweiarchaeum tengchongense]MCW1300373.1 hypothetical protein [Candidatus Jingweiarchaeum tengchongense]MCW1304782.1 hypothetical protein [Candidatus Jingweiarchaeum tengchongense]MCW1305372.1 hypothetical protein [Candidatus Jingweiarchaeum tengchongense]
MGVVDSIRNKIPLLRKKEEDYSGDIGAFPEYAEPAVPTPPIQSPGLPPELQLGMSTQAPLTQTKSDTELIKSQLELLSTKIESIKVIVERIDQRLTFLEHMISER